MLAGARYGMDSIPNRWLKVLDEKVHIRCPDQAQALLALSGQADCQPGILINNK
jgi:hypothetical protein